MIIYGKKRWICARKEGTKMKSAQDISTKEQNITSAHNENMKGSSSEKNENSLEADFDYYLSSKYSSKSDSQRDLYFEKLLEAFKTLSQEAPEVFDSIAPEMLQRSIWSWRGADPLLSKKFNNWILGDYQWTPFDEILPKNEMEFQRQEVPPLDPKQLSEAHQSFIESLQERFYGDPHRWDASRRDQFIILGMLAAAGGYGVRQGMLIHCLGIGLSESGVRGSNAVRAAKIALSRTAKPYGFKLFSPAVGHGSERVHAFENTELAEIVARYVFNHDAYVLLPATPNTPLFQ